VVDYVESQEFVNNTNLSNEALTKILAKNGCFLATKPNGLNLIRENIIAHDKNGNPLEYSHIANSFAAFIQSDYGKEHMGKLNNIERDALSINKTLIKFTKACWPKEKHNDFEKLTYPKIPTQLRYNLTAILSKVHSRNLIVDKNAGVYSAKGNIYLGVFKKNLYKISDYLIKKIEDQLGKENTLTLDDITTKENRNYLKEHFCYQLKEGEPKYHPDIRRYLKKFYGSDKCTKIKSLNK